MFISGECGVRDDGVLFDSASNEGDMFYSLQVIFMTGRV